jgi:hypothetical protein
MRLPTIVDRGFVRFMMMKRLSTGTACLVGGVAAFGFTATHYAELQAKQWALLALLHVICFAGGAWMIRDGLHLRKLLRAN